MIKHDDEALQSIIDRFAGLWHADAELAVKFLYEQLGKGIKTDKAIKAVEKKFPQLFLLPGITDCLVEAAALGCGIVPDVLTSAQQSSIVRDLSKSWDASGMTLSQKLHSARREMRKSIELIIKTQLRKNTSWIEAARALYDGYNAGHTVRIQELPKYLNEVRRAAQGSFEAMGSARKALRNIQRLSAKGAPTKSLKAAYTQLVKAAETGSSKQLEKAVWTAMQEKSRYVAERIIRTETARAYTDGFLAQSAADEDVVGFRWRLSTRHPVYDICNMYAKANIFGLGKGVFPKDKVPKLPVHPHCMCRLEEVYDGEINQEKEKANTDKAINDWLDSQDDDVQERLLGVKGAKEWSKDGDWQQHMRGWQGFENPKSRLHNAMSLNNLPPTDKFIKSIAEKNNLPYTIGKKGEERFYDDDGNPIYPMNDGFVGKPTVVKLKAGSLILDRYGGDKGSFVAPFGTDLEKRALPKTTRENAAYHVYKVIKDLDDVLAGETAPWFAQKGGGVQYKLPDTIINLQEYLQEVNKDEMQ